MIGFGFNITKSRTTFRTSSLDLHATPIPSITVNTGMTSLLYQFDFEQEDCQCLADIPNQITV